MDRLMKPLFSLMLGALAALIAWAIRTLVLNALNLDPYGLALLDGGTVGLLAGAVIAGFEK